MILLEDILKNLQRVVNLTKVKIIIHTENSRRFSTFYYIVYILNENYLSS